MIEGGEHLRAARRWDALETRLRSHFSRTCAATRGAHLHLGEMAYHWPHHWWLHASENDVSRALRLAEYDVDRAIALLYEPVERLHGRQSGGEFGRRRRRVRDVRRRWRRILRLLPRRLVP